MSALHFICVLAQSVERPPHNREVVGSILAASYQKTLKGGSCCYPVWRSTFERDRATSTWRCSVAAGPTINWAKRISKKDFPFRIFHFRTINHYYYYYYYILFILSHLFIFIISNVMKQNNSPFSDPSSIISVPSLSHRFSFSCIFV